MIPYTVKRTGNEVVDRNFDSIAKALEVIIGHLLQPAVISFVSLGSNGVGSVQLTPPKMPDGTSPLYRALAGARLVAAIDLTTNQSLQTSFEQTLSKRDVIQQASSANLSANTLLFILQN